MTRAATNRCPACPQSRKGAKPGAAGWATDGSGTHATVMVDGLPVHVECLDATSRFIADYLFPVTPEP